MPQKEQRYEGRWWEEEVVEKVVVEWKKEEHVGQRWYRDV